MNNSETKIIRTACPAHCGIDACGILAHVKDGRVIKLEPAEFPDPSYKRICLRGLSSLEVTYHKERLKYPMKRVGERGEGKFERISWDEALDTIADRFKAIADEHGWPAIGWTLGGPGAGTTKFGAYLKLASLTGSTRVSAWGYGDAGLPCGSLTLFGTHTPYALLHGMMLWGPSPEMVVAWGCNPAESQPLNGMRPIMDLKEKGAYVVAVDPRFTVTASKADRHIGLKPGTDAALALGMMQVIFKENLQDDAFILRHTVGSYLVRTDSGAFFRKDPESEYMVWDSNTGSAVPRTHKDLKPELSGIYEVDGVEVKPAFQLLKELTDQYPPDHAATICGIDADTITRFARRIGRASKTAFITNMGFTRTYHGDISMRAMGTLAAVTGNVRATFSGGHRPGVLNWKSFLNAGKEKPGYKRLGILPMYEAVISQKPYPLKAAWFSFINYINQCVDTKRIVEEIIPRLDFIVTAELFMTPTAKYADIVLPVTSFLEFSDFVPFPFPYVQLQKKAMEPLYETRSDVDIAGALAKRFGLEEHFFGEEGFIDELLDSKDPSMEGITREALEKGPMPLNMIPDLDREYDIPFSTPSGKIEIYSEKLKDVGQALPVYLPPFETPLDPENKKYPLAFIQGHTRFRTHSSFANVKSLSDMDPGPYVEMNPEDAEARGIASKDRVAVFNDRARTTLVAHLTTTVPPGVVNIHQGWWIDDFEQGSVNHLTHAEVNPVQAMIYEPNMHMNDVAVEVERLGPNTDQGGDR